MTSVSGKQSLGQRETQEDAYRIVRQSEQDPNGDILMLLADGMGGHAGGEVASNLALEAFEHHFSNVSQNPKPRQRLKEGLMAANAAVAKRVTEEPGLKGMGCTLIAALKVGDRLLWASVGDSVLFLYRNHKLRRLNVDHSLYGELLEMVRAGKMTQAEADSHPKRNALRSAIMGENVALMDINGVELKPGDLVLLASDGLETLSDDEIASIVSSDLKADVRAVASDLLNAVDNYARPKQDNTTVTLYRHVREGMSGFYRDSRWKLGASANDPAVSGSAGVLKPILIGVASGLGVLALAFMVWKIGFGSVEPEENKETVTPAPLPVDRSEGSILDDVGIEQKDDNAVIEPKDNPVQPPADGAADDDIQVPDEGTSPENGTELPDDTAPGGKEDDSGSEDIAPNDSAPDEAGPTGENNTEGEPGPEAEDGTPGDAGTKDDFDAGAPKVDEP